MKQPLAQLHTIYDFAKLLDLAELDFDAEDVADAAWLAQFMPAEKVPDSVRETEGEEEDSHSQVPPIIKPRERIPTNDTLPVAPATATSPQTKDTEDAPPTGIPIQIPAAPALRARRDLAKALRPIMRKVSSHTATVFNPDATTENIADQGIWMAVMTPAPERWFELAIVVEQSRSTPLWQDTLAELKLLTECQGAFRRVNTWQIQMQGDGPVLHPKWHLSDTPQPACNHKTLIDPAGRRLIWLVSDCTSDLWQQPQIYQWLRDWGRHCPTALVQLFPGRLWRRTALGDGVPVRLSAYTPGVPNTQLRASEVLPYSELIQALGKQTEQTLQAFHKFQQAPLATLPVVSLEAYPLNQWAKVIAGSGDVYTPGYSFNEATLQAYRERKQAIPASRQLSTKERVQQFQKTASEVAFKLAGLMAAAPVSPPIIQLIQQTLLPESQQVHVAEIYMSGLLRAVTPVDAKLPPHKIQYDFLDGEIRECLTDYVPIAKTEAVLNAVSAYISERLGLQTNTYEALLLLDLEGRSKDQEIVLPFARIAKRALQRLGGEYAEFVETLETQPGEAQASSLPSLEEFKFSPPLITFTDDSALPLIEKQTVENATIILESSSLYEFEFEIVALLKASELEIQHPTEETIFFRADRFDDPPQARSQPYQNYEALRSSEQEGEDYRIRLREADQSTAILALHGGKIEPGTSEIADAVAGEELTFYGFEGLKAQGNHLLGIKEVNFDEPRLVELVPTIDHLLEIHGVASLESIVFIGGTDQAWIQRLEVSLTNAGFSVQPSEHGRLKRQFCNRGKSGQGVYLELSQGLREQLFASLELSDSPDSLLFDHFVRTIRSTISSLASEWKQQRQRSQAQAFSEDLGDGIELEMVAIPSGTFMMGSEEGAIFSSQDEGPQHQVNVSEFYMGRYPVTQSQWRAVAALPQIERKLQPTPSRFKGDDLPVENVSWYDAVEFCQRLSQLTQKEYRLPSEAEWEYACRAGTTTAFHFGNMITTDIANYNGQPFNKGPSGNSRSQTTKVSEFRLANAFGLSDMHGNVWEWCEDVWHDNYDGAPIDGSAWVEGESNRRILRGGSWDGDPVNCRSACRYINFPDYGLDHIGFRVVCAVRGTP